LNHYGNEIHKDRVIGSKITRIGINNQQLYKQVNIWILKMIKFDDKYQIWHANDQTIWKKNISECFIFDLNKHAIFQSVRIWLAAVTMLTNFFMRSQIQRNFFFLKSSYLWWMSTTQERLNEMERVSFLTKVLGSNPVLGVQQR
jgi:hypothetical protein